MSDTVLGALIGIVGVGLGLTIGHVLELSRASQATRLQAYHQFAVSMIETIQVAETAHEAIVRGDESMEPVREGWQREAASASVMVSLIASPRAGRFAASAYDQVLAIADLILDVDADITGPRDAALDAVREFQAVASVELRPWWRKLRQQ